MSESTKPTAMETTTPAAEVEGKDDSKNAEETTAAEVTPQKPVQEVLPKSQGRSRKTPKRMSFTERAQKESEELVKNMGGSLEIEGGRRTRSSARGATPVVVTPPPAKRARTSPASASKSTEKTPHARGRGRKIDAESPPEPESDTEESKKEEVKEVAAAKSSKTNDVEKEGEQAAKDNADSEPSSEAPKKDVDESKVDDAQQLKPEPEIRPDGKDELNNDAGKVAEDQLDAVALPKEEATTETSSDKAESKPDTIQNPPKVSPMDVDDAESIKPIDDKEKLAEHSSLPAQTTASPEKHQVSDLSPIEAEKPVAKQPTPEPMEVDSSSKSNDAIGQDVTDCSSSTVTTNVDAAEKSIDQKSADNTKSAPPQQNAAEAVCAGPQGVKAASDAVPAKPEQQSNSNNLNNSPFSQTHFAKKPEEQETKVERVAYTPLHIASGNDAANKVASVASNVFSQGHSNQANDIRSFGNNIHEDNRNISHLGAKSSQELCEPQIVSPTQMTSVPATAAANNTLQ